MSGEAWTSRLTGGKQTPGEGGCRGPGDVQTAPLAQEAPAQLGHGVLQCPVVGGDERPPPAVSKRGFGERGAAGP